MEKRAREARLGLWAGENPIPPWEWRKQKRSDGSKTSKSNIKSGAGIYHGNVKSKVLHGSGCQHYNCKNCTAVFDSVEKALKAGYRRHEKCVRN